MFGLCLKLPILKRTHRCFIVKPIWMKLSSIFIKMCVCVKHKRLNQHFINEHIVCDGNSVYMYVI